MRNVIYLFICCVVASVLANTSGCIKRAVPLPSEKSNLKLRLSQLHGKFTWRDDLGRYDYSKKLEIEKALSTQIPERSVAILVDCLDDESESRSKIDNKPVPLGIICYEALTQLVYYEPTSANGDIAKNWPGHITPKSSFQEMQKAKQAWEKVLRTKSYVFQ